MKKSGKKEVKSRKKEVKRGKNATKCHKKAININKKPTTFVSINILSHFHVPLMTI